MIEGDSLVLPADALAQAKALLRAGDAGEDTLIADMLASAGSLCERFTGQVLIARNFRETLGRPSALAVRSHGWRRLARTPVRSIATLEAIGPDGEVQALAPADYAIDIDGNGDGWVRTARAQRSMRVTFEAGLASGWSEVPEALRQGILRLAAHLYTFRTDAGAQAKPPAAVTALWRPWRRLRLG
jgi:uncharacterized phiE125 gp8 family phage protein